MPRLTDKEKAEVITDFAAGKSKTEIARKFGCSDTAISKILRSSKSLEKVETKLSKSQKELRREIIRKATEALYGKDFEELCPETLLKVIERLSILEGDNAEQDNEIRVTLAIEDVSGGEDGQL